MASVRIDNFGGSSKARGLGYDVILGDPYTFTDGAVISFSDGTVLTVS